tara:strand:- start:17 stop:319 length:303 start_codon:yes stop_codon:yes gene_type:complete
MYVGETAWWLKGRGILHPGCGLGSNKQPLQTTPKLMAKLLVKVPVEHKEVGSKIFVDVSDNIPFTDEWLDEAQSDFEKRQKALELEFQDPKAWMDFQRDK